MAVYTSVSKTDLDAFLRRYDVGELVGYHGVCEGITNTNYIIEAGVGRYVLTLFEKRYRLEDLPYFVELMEWWRRRGVPCPAPVRMKDGRTIGALCGKPAIIVEFLEGAAPTRITPEHLALVGDAAARMHIAGSDFPHRRENALALPAWLEMAEEIGDAADSIIADMSGIVADELRFLGSFWPQSLPEGPIHADLFPDNIFFSRALGRPLALVGIIDCYFACNDFWAYDIAVAVNALCFDSANRLVPERVQALMEGYNAVRPMTDEEERSFPVLLRGAALRFLLTRAADALAGKQDAIMDLKDPSEYAAKLMLFRNQ